MLLIYSGDARKSCLSFSRTSTFTPQSTSHSTENQRQSAHLRVSHSALASVSWLAARSRDTRIHGDVHFPFASLARLTPWPEMTLGPRNSGYVTQLNSRPRLNKSADLKPPLTLNWVGMEFSHKKKRRFVIPNVAFKCSINFIFIYLFMHFMFSFLVTELPDIRHA